MADFVSDIKTIPHGDDKVFAMLSDLSNLERVKDRIPQDKLQNFTFDRDTCSFSVSPVGSVEFKIIEREPNRTIKFETTNSPVPLTMWIQLKQVETNDTKMKMTVRADLNPFIKPMVSKPLQEAVDRISDVLANLPYSE
ncbi:MAG: SRPBCC family protein [Tannerella sp.]|jgi:carbon monoxide dehydrogenase subunit G|nr:SRPBCC family protein [Tannerella sp.]